MLPATRALISMRPALRMTEKKLFYFNQLVPVDRATV
jgi:hypothetical protein